MSRISLIVCLIVAMHLGGCSPAKDTEEAEQAVAQFRSQMASGALADIYAGAAPEWRRSVSRSDSDAFLGAVTRKLGAFKTSTQTGWRDNVDTRGHTVVLQYRTAFEGGGADETFTILLNDGKGTLAGYHINSLAMMIK